MTLKPRVKILVGVLLSFMVLFTSVGYAVITGNLQLNVEVTYTPLYDGVIITSVEQINSTATGINVNGFVPTNLDSTISGTTGQTITYKITVKNYSSYKQSYAGIALDKTLYDNGIYGTGLNVVTKNSVSDTANTFGVGTTIEASGTTDSNGNPLDTLTFYATYTIMAGAPDTFRTVLNYQFGIHTDDEGVAAVDGALAQFEQILNNSTSYQTLMNKYNSSQRDYIGNVATSLVAGWFTDDDEVVLELFGDKLTLGETEVKTLIQEAEVDGKIGDEMVIYLTPTDIIGLGISNSRTYITDVYCAVFTNSEYDADGNPTGTWYQIGDLYNGRAYGQRYTTGINPNGWFNADSIKPSTWVSVAGVYNASNDYSYSVVADRSISNVIQATNNSVLPTGQTANQVLADLLADAKLIMDGNFSGSGWTNFTKTMTTLKDVYRVYTEDSEGNYVIASDVTHAQSTTAIKVLADSLTPFQSWLNSQSGK